MELHKHGTWAGWEWDMLSSWKNTKPYHSSAQQLDKIKACFSPTMGCGLSCTLHIITDDKHATIKEVQCCWFLEWRDMLLSNTQGFCPWLTIYNSETHAVANHWGKWDCLHFRNHIQPGVLPTVGNTVRLSGLISFRINKCVFSKITAAFSNFWDHPNPTEHLGMESTGFDFKQK